MVGDVRGRGIFRGIELVRDRETKAPFPAEVALTQRIVERALNKGLVVIGGMPGCADGVHGDQLQISPALVFTEQELDRALQLLWETIEEVRSEVMRE